VNGTFSSFDAFILTTFSFQVRKKGEVPPAKKTKTGSGAVLVKQSSAKGSRQRKSLIGMPLDVLFEVKN